MLHPGFSTRCVSIIAALMLQSAGPEAPPLSDQQVREAIEMGRAGNVPIVQVGTWLGISKGDFDVFIEGPMARIAAEARRAFRLYQPYDALNVTESMRAPIYRVFFRQAEGARGVGFVERIVLQAKGAKGMDSVVQPLRETIGIRFISEVYFDHFPDGEFDVVLVTTQGPQKYNVTEKQRAKIR